MANMGYDFEQEHRLVSTGARKWVEQYGVDTIWALSCHVYRMYAFMKAHGHTAEYDEWIAELKMDFDKLRNGSVNP